MEKTLIFVKYYLLFIFSHNNLIVLRFDFLATTLCKMIIVCPEMMGEIS